MTESGRGIQWTSEAEVSAIGCTGAICGAETGSNCRTRRRYTGRFNDALRSEGALGSPLREICAAGSDWGDEFKRSRLLGEGTGTKAPDTARLSNGYGFKARLYRRANSVHDRSAGTLTDTQSVAWSPALRRRPRTHGTELPIHGKRPKHRVSTPRRYRAIYVTATMSNY